MHSQNECSPLPGRFTHLEERAERRSIQRCQCLRSCRTAGIIDDLFAIAGDSRPPENVEELTQAFDGLGLEEDIEEKEEDKADEDEEVAERNGRAAKSVRNQSTETVMRLPR